MTGLPREDLQQRVEEAHQEMLLWGIDPESDRAWLELALCLIEERRLIAPALSEDGEKVEISKETYDRLKRVAGPAFRLVRDHRRIEKSYRAISKPTQREALEHAIAALSRQDAWFQNFSISRFGGLPTPLRLVLADLINVLEGRLGRLVSPKDSVIEYSIKVSDSPTDRIRLTIKAYAASTVHRLVKKKWSKRGAAKAVAEALQQAGFTKPNSVHAVKSDAVQVWYESAIKGTCAFAEEYEQALRVPEADAELLLKALQDAIRPLIFERS